MSVAATGRAHGSRLVGGGGRGDLRKKHGGVVRALAEWLCPLASAVCRRKRLRRVVEFQRPAAAWQARARGSHAVADAKGQLSGLCAGKHVAAAGARGQRVAVGSQHSALGTQEQDGLGRGSGTERMCLLWCGQGSSPRLTREEGRCVYLGNAMCLVCGGRPRPVQADFVVDQMELFWGPAGVRSWL